MHDLLIKNAKLITGEWLDIAILKGKIDQIGKLDISAKQTLDLGGKLFVSAGWIDLHTHCFSTSPLYYDEPDLIGVNTGVTTVVDAGSVGTNDIAKFDQIASKAKTAVYTFLNISTIGLIRQNELANMDDIDAQQLDNAIANYPHFIVGLKARISKSVVGDNNIIPLIQAKSMQKKSGLPLMVHIGNTPPDLAEIAELLTKGDIITHCFNGKPNQILDADGALKTAIKHAIDRGVLLDVGHGAESFSFNVAERAHALGIYANTISSDIYYKNRINGPVYNLANVMTKFIAVGYTPSQIIDCVTSHAANTVHLKNKGQLAVGFDADLTLFDLEQKPVTLSDAHGVIRECNQRFSPYAAVVSGTPYITQEGTDNGFYL